MNMNFNNLTPEGEEEGEEGEGGGEEGEDEAFWQLCLLQ